MSGHYPEAAHMKEQASKFPTGCANNGLRIVVHARIEVLLEV